MASFPRVGVLLSIFIIIFNFEKVCCCFNPAPALTAACACTLARRLPHGMWRQEGRTVSAFTGVALGKYFQFRILFILEEALNPVLHWVRRVWACVTTNTLLHKGLLCSHAVMQYAA